MPVFPLHIDVEFPTDGRNQAHPPAHSYLTQTDIHELACKFVSHLDTSVTTAVCLCTWIDHPIDVQNGIQEGNRRKMIVEANRECPVHTKEGAILGFFKWLVAHDHGIV